MDDTYSVIPDNSASSLSPAPVLTQESIDSITSIITHDYGSVSSLIKSVLKDVTDLYNGQWPDYAPCQVGYHTIKHALDVTLAFARIISGYHIQNPDNIIPEHIYSAGITAALLHDSGYLKNKKDVAGKGGKFSFSHVERSILLVDKYLTRLSWPPEQIQYVRAIIELSDFTHNPEIPVFSSLEQDIVAKAVATADLIAQIADVDYIKRLHLLYEELLEAYEFEGKKNLTNRSIHVYESFQELQDETVDFYKNFILPRLHLFDRVDRNLIIFFKNGRNPYSENIIANLSGQLKNDRTQWQKLGETLKDLGFVSEATITEALKKQQLPHTPQSAPSLLQQSLKHHIEGCHYKKSRNKSLGNILMEMEALAPHTLRQGLLNQILPSDLISHLSHKEVNILLETSLLLQNVYNDPWMFSQVLEIINELLETESCSLLLANPEQTELIVAVQAGKMLGGLLGESNSLDKGLSGWVFRHKKAAIVTEESIDDFFPEYFQEDTKQIRSVLASPLHLHGEVIGVIEAYNRGTKQSSEHDINLMTLLAHIISNSLSILCRLYKE